MSIVSKLVPDLDGPGAWRAWAGLVATLFATLTLGGPLQLIACICLAIAAILLLIGMWRTWVAPHWSTQYEPEADEEEGLPWLPL